MQLDHRHARRRRGLDLCLLRIDEQRDPYAGGSEPGTALPQPLAGAGHVQAAFGGQLGAPLRHQAAIGGRTPQAKSIIAGVAAISRFMRVLSRPASSCTSRSWIWRRSSRSAV
jgi:hypothetical protein